MTPRIGNKTLIHIFCLFLVMISYSLLWNRIRFGIDFTDESWYVAEPYIVAQGAIPYVNNWTQAPGFTIPLALAFKLFVMISGGTEGIVFFSRILYVIVSFIVYGISVFYICREYKKSYFILCMIPLLFLNTSALYDLNYDSIGVMYLLLGSCFFFLDRRVDEKINVRDVISGIIIARAIIASPSVLAGWSGILIILFFCRDWNRLKGFIVGNTVSAILVIGWCCIRGGITGFINGIRIFFTETSYFHMEQRHTFQEDVFYLLNYSRPLLIALSVIFIIKVIKRKTQLLSDNQCYNCVAAVCCMALLIGMVLTIFSRSYTHIVRYGWFVAILIGIFAKRPNFDENDGNNKRLLYPAFISALYFAVYILTSVTNVYGFGKREYWLIIPTIMGMVTISCVISKKYETIVGLTVSGGLMLLGGLLIHFNYSYVYRDAPIQKLTERIDYGIWKGCYSTPNRAENVKILEQYIRNITDKDDYVLFMDQVCFAYLMNEGNACSPTTADAMAWSYKVDDYKIMADYFEALGRIPDKIIYIDFGRDSELSVDGEWKFNDFLKENYIYIGSFDTNPEEKDKFLSGQIYNYSFYVEFYERREAI